MDHIAIMKKSWGLTEKILSGKKKVESRWYKFKHAPWDKIKKNETIYFKDSGEPITIKAKVEKVIQIPNLTKNKVNEILLRYGENDGLTQDQLPKFFEIFKDKRYCMLIFLKNPQKIKLFTINKKGYGIMSAWISVDNIKKIIN